jgi:hypothetical protein
LSGALTSLKSLGMPEDIGKTKIWFLNRYRLIFSFRFIDQYHSSEQAGWDRVRFNFMKLILNNCLLLLVKAIYSHRRHPRTNEKDFLQWKQISFSNKKEDFLQGHISMVIHLEKCSLRENLLSNEILVSHLTSKSKKQRETIETMVH